MYSGLILKEKNCFSKEFASIATIKARYRGFFFSTFYMLISLELRYYIVLTGALRQHSHSLNIGLFQDKFYIKIENKEKGCFKVNYFVSEFGCTCIERFRLQNQKIDTRFVIVMRLFRTLVFYFTTFFDLYLTSW